VLERRHPCRLGCKFQLRSFSHARWPGWRTAIAQRLHASTPAWHGCAWASGEPVLYSGQGDDAPAPARARRPRAIAGSAGNRI